MLVTVETVLPFYQLGSQLQYGWWIHLWYFYYIFSSQILVYFSDSYEHRFKELSVICGAFCWYTHLRFSILDSFVDYFLFAQQWRHAGFSSQVAELIFNFNSFKIWEKMQSDLLLIAYTTETGLVFLNLLPFSMPSIYSHLNIPKQDHQSTIVNFSTAGVWWWLGCLCLFFYLQSKQRWTRRRCTHLGSSSCSQPFNSIWSPAARHLILKSNSVN